MSMLVGSSKLVGSKSSRSLSKSIVDSEASSLSVFGIAVGAGATVGAAVGAAGVGGVLHAATETIRSHTTTKDMR